ncbi:hypothetical protein ASPWEDRAFT_112861 [Aspergillus wentii DTO 134E9]|uniref:Major facilitator superfamily (MFS) profile domain-containing protein n=1 Tax=Aspergillus wentii DTO 134E9 TaxID=1073089 RepID=A0A1L9RI65_ASPWE|nr:uncharacterized protein ASPWEDRAFT_112861 [Aspergillus wentii DTO 134E9]OJJ34614.1 hypothetical protein ASPWEDRAFT_112861 [Aspergillus wentii DTO 134E9]
MSPTNNQNSSSIPTGSFGNINQPEETRSMQLSTTTLAITMTSLCLSVTLSALDLTIITTALPTIVSDFGSVAGYTWIGSSFILAYTAIVPIYGTVADIWGRKPIILIALSTFLVGSIICATVNEISSFIVGRVIQGLGAAGMGTLVNVIICDMLSLRDRGLYLAITAVIWAVGSAVGPVLGGVLTSRANWRWCFWINLPIGGVVFFVFIFVLKLPSPKTPIRAGLKAIDWTGSVLSVGSILMILLGLNFGGVTYPWASATVICLIVMGCVVVALFILYEWKFARNPIIPLRLFSSISPAAAYAVFSFNAYVFMGIAYYLPLYSQSVFGANALRSGLYLLPLVVASSLAAAAAGVFIQKTGKYIPVMYIGQVLLTLGVGLFVYLKHEESPAKMFGFSILAGVGIGMNIDAPILAAQAVVPVRDTAAVTATMALMRSISTAISVVVGGVVFQNRMNAENPGLVDTLGNDVAKQFNGADASVNVEQIHTLPRAQQEIVKEVYFRALRTTWTMYVAFAGLATILTLFIRAHHLSTRNEGVVLGVDRDNAEAVPVVDAKSQVHTQEQQG